MTPRRTEFSAGRAIRCRSARRCLRPGGPSGRHPRRVRLRPVPSSAGWSRRPRPLRGFRRVPWCPGPRHGFGLVQIVPFAGHPGAVAVGVLHGVGADVTAERAARILVLRAIFGAQVVAGGAVGATLSRVGGRLRRDRSRRGRAASVDEAAVVADGGRAAGRRRGCRVRRTCSVRAVPARTVSARFIEAPFQMVSGGRYPPVGMWS